MYTIDYDRAHTGKVIQNSSLTNILSNITQGLEFIRNNELKPVHEILVLNPHALNHSSNAHHSYLNCRPPDKSV